MSVVAMVEAAFRRKRPDLAAPTKNQSTHDSMRDPSVRVYGHSGTIHATEDLDIVMNERGEVTAVWFRCQELPFNVSRRAGERARAQAQLPRLVAVEVIDR